MPCLKQGRSSVYIAKVQPCSTSLLPHTTSPKRSKESKAWTMTWMLIPKKGGGDNLKGVSGISDKALIINTPSVIRTTMDRIPLTRIKKQTMADINGKTISIAKSCSAVSISFTIFIGLILRQTLSKI
jgi:hypothetical protein